MEYVHGLSVRELMSLRARMSEGEVLRYAGQVAGALQYAHEQGVYHCDVKLENILVTEQGVAKAVDFGVADTANLDAFARTAHRSWAPSPTSPPR